MSDRTFWAAVLVVGLGIVIILVLVRDQLFAF